ncbi:hypothetical protein AAC387_Pa12g1727 [Persea americana]
MAHSENYIRFLNPFRLHLQKMELELKCAVCLDLFNQPVLLPCDHILCSSCIPSTVELGLSCIICKLPYIRRDLRAAQHIENMLTICRSMCAAFANLSDAVPQAHLSDLSSIPNHRLGSANLGIGDKSRGTLVRNIHSENSRHVRLSLPSFPTNKRVQASFDLNISEVDSPVKPVQSSKKRGCRGNGEYASSGSQHSTHDANKETNVAEENPCLLPFLWSSDQPCQKGGAEERDVDPILQTLPDSPPFDNNKDSDDESSDKRSEKCTKRLATNSVVKEEQIEGTVLEAKPILQSSVDTDSSIDKPKASGKWNVTMNGRQNSPDDDDCTREPKRQKESNFGLHNLSSSTFHMSENPAHKCAFCQFSKESEATGLMMHYADGRAVVADQATQSNVLHAHERCIEWAPRVYFVGETAVNLEAEVERGKKIKCNICAKRGAALGCFAKSCRRSFHVPCAVESLDCHWDHDNFRMFCPVHSSLKLRKGRSKSGKKKRANHSSVIQLVSSETLVPAQSSTTQEADKPWMASPCVTMRWVLCGSALSTAEKDLVTEFASLIGATVTKDWKPNVTHVIASTADMGACSRTLKFLMAILGGKWILKIDWVKACMEAKCPVDEEPYEISSDVHGCRDGPKNGRIRVLDKAPKLFSGLEFFFFGDFVPSYKGYLKDLVIAAGGTNQVKEDMGSQSSNSKITPAMNVIVYNRDPPQDCKSSQLSSIIEQRHGEAEAFAANTGSQVVDHTWLLESIAACRLQPWSIEKPI